MLELRLQLATARANLRSAKDAHELAKAEAEQRAIDNGCSGKNEKERERALLLAISKDDAYLTTLAQFRHLESEAERIDALFEGARDARRAEEWAVRARLADALLRANVQSDGEREAEFDDTADDLLSRGSLNGEYYAGKLRPQPTYSMLRDEDLPF